MARNATIILSCFLACILIGCNDQSNQPVWKDTKVTDLAPADFPTHTDKQSLANLKIYIFQIPTEKIDVLTNLQQILAQEPLEFASYKSFQANSFFAGFGKDEMWAAVLNILAKANAKRTNTVSLLLTTNQANDTIISEIYEQDTIFYISKADKMESIVVSPGRIALRIKTVKIPALKGLCWVYLTPVFLPALERAASQIPESENSSEFVFSSCAFKLKMSQGSFILLAPEKHIDNQVTLGGRFFAGSSNKKSTRLYLITCVGIKD